MTGLADETTLNAIASGLDKLGDPAATRRRAATGAAYAARHLLSVTEVMEWATSGRVMDLSRRLAGERARPVRGLLFDKTAGANWKVAWHQDRSIAVRERVDTPGFGPWSTKAGVTHVQPPVDVLERMVTVRLHLDDCDAANGPLRVVPGSHARGILTPQSVDRLPDECGQATCIAARGDAIVMRPLLLHASSPARSPRRRRVVHVEYCADELPAPLTWHSR